MYSQVKVSLYGELKFTFKPELSKVKFTVKPELTDVKFFGKDHDVFRGIRTHRQEADHWSSVGRF